MSHDEERARDARLEQQRDRAPRHSVERLVLTTGNHENLLIFLSLSKDYQVQEYFGRLSP